jgi:hypothetical protein
VIDVTRGTNNDAFQVAFTCRRDENARLARWIREAELGVP